MTYTITAPVFYPVSIGNSLNESTVKTDGIVVDENGNFVPGNFEFESPNTEVNNSGPYVLKFNPESQYLESQSINVNLDLLTVHFTASSIVLGEALSSSNLSGSAYDGTKSVEGSYFFPLSTYVPPSTGICYSQVIFSPEDKTNYDFIYQFIVINVVSTNGNPFPEASPIIKGQQLKDSILTGNVYNDLNQTISGKWEFVNQSISPDDSGLQTYKFIPDSPRYQPVTDTVNVVVLSNIPLLKNITATAIIKGQNLTYSTLSGEARNAKDEIIEGSLEFINPSNHTPDQSSNQYFKFIPQNPIYETVQNLVNVVVESNIYQIISNPTASSITFGHQLNSSTLTGGRASVDGTFQFSKPNDYPQNLGFNEIEVTFIPKSTFYQSVKFNINVLVSQSEPSPQGHTGNPSCYNEGSKILCLNNDLQEIYIPIENLRTGDLVKTYKHGYRKIDLIGKNVFQNDYNNPLSCMFKMEKTESNGLIEDLIITGGHSILIDEEIYSELGMIDDKYLLLALLSEKFEKLNNTNIYTYYHLCLENEDGDGRYGIWANGILSESTQRNHFVKSNFVLL
jgi:hypothetical protein